MIVARNSSTSASGQKGYYGIDTIIPNMNLLKMKSYLSMTMEWELSQDGKINGQFRITKHFLN